MARRRLLLHVACAFTLAVIAGSTLSLLAWLTGTPRIADYRAAAALLAAALTIALTRRSRTRHASAAAIERSIPACRNLVITAEELERHPTRASAAITTRVSAAADAALGGARPGEVVPLRWIAGILAVGVAAGFLWVPRAQRAVQDAVASVADALPSISTPRVRVRIEPPAYSGQPVATLDSPSTIEALEGSRITFELSGGGRVRFGNERRDCTDAGS